MFALCSSSARVEIGNAVESRSTLRLFIYTFLYYISLFVEVEMPQMCLIAKYVFYPYRDDILSRTYFSKVFIYSFYLD